LAPFLLPERFLVDFLAALRLFFAIGCGSFRSSAQSHHGSIRRGADIRGETSSNVRQWPPGSRTAASGGDCP
jgi:hypothetical protein